MSSVPLNHLLKIGAEVLSTTAQTLSGAINELVTALGNKQDTLTFDNAPTASSNNPVTSDGINTALADKMDLPSSASLGDVMTYGNDGWDAAALPMSGHTMNPDPTSNPDEADIVTAFNTAYTDDDNDEVASVYGISRWTNVKTFRRVITGSASIGSASIGATGIGTWFDGDTSTIVPSTDEADWWYDDAFVIPNDVDEDSIDVKFLFGPLPYGVPIVLGGYLWDTTTGKICLKFANDITDYTATAKIAVDITYTRNEVV